MDVVMEFGLLGPLWAGVAGRTVPIRPTKLRVLLAALLTRAGQPVPVAWLVDTIWADAPPEHPRRTVQMYVTRLRTLLDDAQHGAGALVVTCPDGYLIDIAEERVDLLRFQRRLADADLAASRSDADAEWAALAMALAEWRGEVFSDIPSEVLCREVAPHLREQRMRALERRIGLDLNHGRHAELVSELTALTAREPLRERLWAQLMTALDRAGRRSEALATFQTARQHLADHVGVDPSDELQHLHAAILVGGRASSDTKGSVPLPSVPRQLPPEVRRFTGRAEALAQLDALLKGSASDGGVVISAITGAPGVGKTALAVHWARRVADQFPDGQLWVNLRGYHPAQSVEPAQALTGFLRALGVSAAETPTDLEDQAALYRSLMDGRRVLVVLDNARTVDQVRPLLPGASGCLVIVTSRDRLTSLIAAEAAQPLVLDLLSVDEARQILTVRIGAQRVSAEPEATSQIIHRCDRLPLALAVAAAHVARRPQFPLAKLAAELRDGSSLDVLTSGNPTTDVRSVFSWSYQAVSAAAARLFRLLGLCPGPEISVPVVASMMASSRSDARSLLAELSDAHLINEYVPGRYGLHDLLHTYAAELAQSQDDQEARVFALHRMLDYYLQTAYNAALSIHPRDPIKLAPPMLGVAPGEFADHGQAMSWFTAEQPTLIATVELAASAGLDTHIWQLAWTLYSYLDWQGRWSEQVAIQQAGLEAAIRLDEKVAQASIQVNLAQANMRLERYDQAHQYLRQALDEYKRLGDKTGQARIHLNLCQLFNRQRQHRRGVEHGLLALGLLRAANNTGGQAHALNEIGWCYAMIGEHQRTISYCEQALDLYSELGHRHGMATAWDSLAFAHQHLGVQTKALAYYRHARRLYCDLGDHFREAETLVRLGDSHRQAGDNGSARTAWQEALTILETHRHQQASDDVRARLRAVR